MKSERRLTLPHAPRRRDPAGRDQQPVPRGQGASSQTSLMWSTSPGLWVMLLGLLQCPLAEPSDAEGPHPITVYLPGARGILNWPDEPTGCLSTRGTE